MVASKKTIGKLGLYIRKDGEFTINVQESPLLQLWDELHYKYTIFYLKTNFLSFPTIYK